ncbi:hypothetical protein [Parasitella parasitica]|uniref:Uncharacterized protein n=1 Tax=Parasitella parasitica TaxID=35722 RepID=A0A0B7NDI2_9FUNG|nr:hypothetical protein [Parasitella parasitica]
MWPAPAKSATASSSSTDDEVHSPSLSASRYLNGSSSRLSSLSAPSTTKAKLDKYIEMCKSKADKHEFNLQTEINQVLASKDIILLKKAQFCLELVKYIDAESLLKNIQSDAISKDIKVNSEIFLALVTLLRDINDETDRRALNIELNNLYE